MAFALAASIGCTGTGDEGEMTRLTVPLEVGGNVTVDFQSPLSVRPGEERELVRWTIQSTSRFEASIWTGYAVDGLPDDCSLEVPRWEDTEPLVEGGDAPTDVRYRVGKGLTSGTTAARLTVPADCAGEYELVLAAVPDARFPEASVERVGRRIE